MAGHWGQEHAKQITHDEQVRLYFKSKFCLVISGDSQVRRSLVTAVPGPRGPLHAPPDFHISGHAIGIPFGSNPFVRILLEVLLIAEEGFECTYHFLVRRRRTVTSRAPHKTRVGTCEICCWSRHPGSTCSYTPCTCLPRNNLSDPPCQIPLS